MANPKASSVWGVNELGELVVSPGTGSTNVLGYLSENDVPVDEQGRIVVAGMAGHSVGLRKKNATPMILFTGAGNFTISGTGATKTESYSPLLGPTAITVNGTVGTNGTANLDRAGLNIDIGAHDDFELWFHTPDGTKVNGVSVFFSTDPSGFANNLQAQLLTGAFTGQRDSGWNCLRWKKSEMTPTGVIDKNSVSLVVRQIRVQVFSASGNAVVTFDSLWMDAATRAKAMVMFDDGWSEAYDFNNGQGFFTYMQSKGLKGTMGVIGGMVGISQYMSHGQLRTVYDAGWDLAAHGVEYNGVAGGYQNLTLFPTEAEAIANVKANRNFLLAHGFTRAADFYIYPQGKYTESLIPQLQAVGIKAARGTYETLAFPYFTPDAYLMKLPGVDLGGKTFAQVKPFIDRAIATGGTVVLYGHRLQTAAGGVGNYMTVSEFVQVIDYLAANAPNIDTLTISEWYAQAKVCRIG